MYDHRDLLVVLNLFYTLFAKTVNFFNTFRFADSFGLVGETPIPDLRAQNERLPLPRLQRGIFSPRGSRRQRGTGQPGAVDSGPGGHGGHLLPIGAIGGDSLPCDHQYTARRTRTTTDEV